MRNFAARPVCPDDLIRSAEAAKVTQAEAIRVYRTQLAAMCRDLAEARNRADYWKRLAGRMAGVALCFAALFAAMVVWRVAR